MLTIERLYEIKERLEYDNETETNYYRGIVQALVDYEIDTHEIDYDEV